MGWLNNELTEDETVIFRTRMHIYQILSSLVIALFGFISSWFLYIAVPYFFYTTGNYFYREYVITNMRIIIRQGLFSVQTESIFISQIDDILIRRSLSDKIIRGGTIYIFGSAIETKQLSGLGDPGTFRSALYSQLPATKHGYFYES